MPDTPIHVKADAEQNHANQHPHPFIGMRKVKSILAIAVGFGFWQLLRLFLPELEPHPIFVYIYGLIEIRESSEKTSDYGRLRIVATFTAILMGLPLMFLIDWLRPMLEASWQLWLEIGVLLVGSLAVLCVAELVKCGAYIGLAATIYIILMLSHFESSVYLHSIMRAVQTIVGVIIAWVINVKLLPYPPRPGSLSYWLAHRKDKTRKE